MSRLAVLTQYLLPKQSITAFAGIVASARAGKITTAIIRWFIERYEVNMQEAAEPNITAYSSFNEFFTRALREDIRPIAQSDFVCPVDGTISQFGDIRINQIFQAKGHFYSTETLLAGDQTLADYFIDGKFATLYLSPKDYHRIHMPCTGLLKKMTYVPGSLFSVNPLTAQSVPGLFARNERVICEFESSYGKFALILVGATIVGSMATIWHGIVNPPRSRNIRSWEYTDQAVRLDQGVEMGRFLLGSTVVVLYPKDVLTFNPDWQTNKPVKLGEIMGNAL
jgi:phosphatidylserine decarboxylase